MKLAQFILTTLLATAFLSSAGCSAETFAGRSSRSSVVKAKDLNSEVNPSSDSTSSNSNGTNGASGTETDSTETGGTETDSTETGGTETDSTETGGTGTGGTGTGGSGTDGSGMGGSGMGGAGMGGAGMGGSGMGGAEMGGAGMGGARTGGAGTGGTGTGGTGTGGTGTGGTGMGGTGMGGTGTGGTGTGGTETGGTGTGGTETGGTGTGGTGTGGTGTSCAPVASKVSWETYQVDTAVTGIIFTTEAGSPHLTMGQRMAKYGPNSTLVSHWAITKDNHTIDSFCRSKGYDGGLASCKKSSENIEGIIISNLTSTIAGQARWALGCEWGAGVVRTPDSVACVTFAKKCPSANAPTVNLWINYSGRTSPQSACIAAGFSDTTALCKGRSVVSPVKATEGTIAWNGSAAKCMYGDRHFGPVSAIMCSPQSNISSSPHTAWVNLSRDTTLNGSGQSEVMEFSTPTQVFKNSLSVTSGAVFGGGQSFGFHSPNQSASEICKAAGHKGFSGLCQVSSGHLGGLTQNKASFVNGQFRWASACLTGGGTTAPEMTHGIATKVQCIK